MKTEPEYIERMVLRGMCNTLLTFLREIYLGERTGQLMFIKEVRQAARETYKEVNDDLQNLHDNIYGNDD